MEYARIEGSTVIERRVIETMPPHKAHLWRPVVYEGAGPLSDVVIEADRVRVVQREPALDSIKSEIKKKIDTDAEAIRQRFLTAGAGMVMTYQEKFAQAQAVAAMGEAANALSQADREAQFPTLSASVGIEAPTLLDAANLVLAKYAEFARLSMRIERARLGGKAAVNAATTAAEVNAAYQAIEWTLS